MESQKVNLNKKVMKCGMSTQNDKASSQMLSLSVIITGLCHWFAQWPHSTVCH